MRSGLKSAAVFAALGMATLWSAPDAGAWVGAGNDDLGMTAARTAEVIGDIKGAHGARVITVRMPDGEQFTIHDWSAGDGPVRRVTHRDFDRDGDLEVRIAYRDGRVVEIDDEDVDFDDLDADRVALLAGDGRLIWEDSMALRFDRETERAGVDASPTVAGDEVRAYEHTDVRASEMDLDVRSASTITTLDFDELDEDVDADVHLAEETLPSDGSAMNMTNDIRETPVGEDAATDDENAGLRDAADRETEIIEMQVDNDVHMSSVNSYRSSSAPVDRSYRITESDATVSSTNPSTSPSDDADIGVDDDSFVAEVADKAEDAGDMSKRAVTEIVDKTDDAWDATKKGAVEAADKLGDAKGEAPKASKRGNRLARGLKEIGDKLEDVKDFFTGNSHDDDR